MKMTVYKNRDYVNRLQRLAKWAVKGFKTDVATNKQSFADEVTLHGFLKASSGDVYDGSSAIHDLVIVDCFFQRIKINQII